jgi:hypothetical protein
VHNLVTEDSCSQYKIFRILCNYAYYDSIYTCICIDLRVYQSLIDSYFYLYNEFAGIVYSNSTS